MYVGVPTDPPPGTPAADRPTHLPPSPPPPPPSGPPKVFAHGWVSIFEQAAPPLGDVQFPLMRGIKEGCPISPALFVVVCEAFHQTLTQEFLNGTMLAYVDDIAIISLNKREMMRFLLRVTQLSAILGLKTKPAKTQIYQWAPPPRRLGIKGRGMVRHTTATTASCIPLPGTPVGSPVMGAKSGR